MIGRRMVPPDAPEPARPDAPQGQQEPSLGSRLLARAALVLPGEGRAVAWAALFFFVLLCSNFVLRPLRDSFGIEGGVDKLPRMFYAVLLGTLLASPLFSVLVSRWPRRVFLPVVYRFCALNLLVFLLLYKALPQEQLVHVGKAFFIWLSVFNLFGVSVLGGFLSDIFTLEQGKRLFALIGVGGTCGALFGSWLAGRMAEWVTPQTLPLWLFGLGMILLESAAQCVHQVRRVAPQKPEDGAQAAPEEAMGGGMLEGIALVLRSPYLQGICGYLFLQSFVATVLYFQQAGIVDAAFPDRVQDRGARTAFLADVSFYTQALTLFLQLFFSGRILKRLGLGWTLAALPLITLLALGGLAVAPTLAVIAIAQVLNRGINFATAKPAREALYTLATRAERYKSKSFIDTFVYRGGDALGAKLFESARGLGLTGVAWAAMPIVLVWSAVGLSTGRRTEALRAKSAAAAAPAEGAAPPVQ